jgi:LacI family transcriptional regulator
VQRHRLIGRLVDMGLPVVMIQERYKAPSVCCVRQDDRGGASEVARHLIGGGARKIFMLLPEEEWPAMNEREKGVRAVCTRAGAELVSVRCGDEGVDDTRRAVAAALAAHGIPDAVLGGNDRMAVAAMMQLMGDGIVVPDEVRVTGFNGFEWGHFGVPKLTTVRSAAYQIGQRAGAELLSYFKDGSFESPEVVLPVTFVPGQTS